jgi:hypothetical protein
VTCLALYLHPDPVLRRGLVDGSVSQVVLKRRTCPGDGRGACLRAMAPGSGYGIKHCRCEGRGWLPALVPESATPTQVREVGSPDLGWRAFEGDDETWSSLDLSDDFRCRTSLVPGRLGIVEYQWPGTEPRQVVSVVRPVTERLPVVEPWAAALQPGDVVLFLGAPEPLAEPITEMACPKRCWENTMASLGQGYYQSAGQRCCDTRDDGHPTVPLAVEAGSVEEVETP